MKRLKFAGNLTEKMLAGKKTNTWRVDDEKNIQEGDELECCRVDGIPFAKAVVTKVKETTFGELTDEDKAGHETYASEEEKYKTYTEYYKKEVTAATPVKVIYFKIMPSTP